MESQKLTQYKIVYKFDFLYLTFLFFSFIFYNKFVKTCHFFLCKTAYFVKKQDFFPKNILENCSFYGLDTEKEPEPETEP